MTTPLVTFRYLALDSSSLANLARDFVSGYRGQAGQARAFLDSLEAADCLLLISFDAMLELIQHRDEAVAGEPLELFARMPLLAWITPRYAQDVLGGILDILYYELRAALHGAKTFTQVVSTARGSLFQIGPGHALVNALGPALTTLRTEAIRRTCRRQAVASLARVDIAESLDATLADTERMGSRDPQHVIEFMWAQLESRLSRELELKAPKLENPAAEARDFLLKCAVAVR